MPRFPKSEAEIIALAELMWRGLQSNPLIYPSPPIPWMIVRGKNNEYIIRKNESISAQAEAELATAAKDDALDTLIQAMKDDLRYAENTVDFDDDKLKLIGWAGKAAPTPLAVPGQTRLLEAPRQGEGWVFLDWKSPLDGGRPAAYNIERRERPSGPWEHTATAIETEAILVDQPRGPELEYRIIAVNKAGVGQPSNTVMVVL